MQKALEINWNRTILNLQIGCYCENTKLDKQIRKLKPLLSQNLPSYLVGEIKIKQKVRLLKSTKANTSNMHEVQAQDLSLL